LDNQSTNKDSALLMVSVDVFPGKEDEFNDWYDDHHIPNYASKMPRLRSIRRYHTDTGEPQFIAIYRYDSADDLKASLLSIRSVEAANDGRKQFGKLVKSFSCVPYNQVYP
jgi:antibiotic biosynthesis monooxygenase (ABM) superfamily enzyme